MAHSNDEFDARAAFAGSLESICDDDNSSIFAKGTIGKIDPGLEIEGIGGIGVPVSENDAQRVISMSRQAPFWKGSDTIIDTTVLRTWEIDANRLKLRHPKWALQQREIVDDIAKQLGISRGQTLSRPSFTSYWSMSLELCLSHTRSMQFKQRTMFIN